MFTQNSFCSSMMRAKTIRRSAADHVHAAPRSLRICVRAGLDPVRIPAQKLSREAFAPFGQVCTWQEDMKPYDHDDAQLDLSQGTPRFYIMRIPGKGMKFNSITHHKKVTQALGALGDQSWYMALAPSDVDAPSAEDVSVFEIPPGTFINMKKGTWHAGPLFVGDHIDFYNLELSDTNITDHMNFSFKVPIEIESIIDHDHA
mmetsp:Transcript_4025/g.7816  ORF Transcript_4025/g.7816 Transcript_4025/m.7816 type:complete len:202 (+) Transcript_4025:80-685(+)